MGGEGLSGSQTGRLGPFLGLDGAPLQTEKGDDLDCVSALLNGMSHPSGPPALLPSGCREEGDGPGPHLSRCSSRRPWMGQALQRDTGWTSPRAHGQRELCVHVSHASGCAGCRRLTRCVR